MPDMIFYIVFSFSACAIPVTTYIVYKLHTNTYKTEPEFVPGLFELLLWSITFTVILLIFGYSVFELAIVEFNLLYSLSLLVPAIYTFRLFELYDLYAQDSQLYVDPSSSASAEWEVASIAFAKSIYLWESKRKIDFVLGVFWSLLAVGRYQSVMEKVDDKNDIEYKGAKQYALSSLALNTAFIRNTYNSEKANNNLDDFEEYLEQAHITLNTRRCDECNRVYKKGNMHRILDENEVETSIKCNGCYTQSTSVNCPHCGRSVNPKFISQKYCIYCNTHNSENEQNQKQQKKEHQKQYTTDTQTESTLKKHCSALEIQPPLTEEKITNAYREKVKNTHPDMPNGNQKEFKKIQTAKEQLLKHTVNEE